MEDSPLRKPNRLYKTRNNRRSRKIRHPDGRCMCAAEWALELGITQDALWHRLGPLEWSVKRALSGPVVPYTRRRKKSERVLTYRGRTLPLADWARVVDISLRTIRMRVDKGWSPEAVLRRTDNLLVGAEPATRA